MCIRDRSSVLFNTVPQLGVIVLIKAVVSTVNGVLVFVATLPATSDTLATMVWEEPSARPCKSAALMVTEALLLDTLPV